MNEYVMRHPKLGADQDIIVHANDESELGESCEQYRAGWRLVKKDPEKVREESEPAEPVNPKK